MLIKLLVIKAIVSSLVVLISHQWHLIRLPGLAWNVVVLGSSVGPGLPSIEVSLELLKTSVLIGSHQQLLNVHSWWHHVKRWLALIILAWASMHAGWGMVSMLVHKLRLLVVTCKSLQLLLLRHVVEWRLHTGLIELGSEASDHVSFIHTVRFLIMVEIRLKLLIHHKVLSLGGHWYTVMNSGMAT